MASLNRVQLIGYLGADPEVRHTPNGTTVAKFNIATQYHLRGEDGSKQQRSEWHRIVAWGRLGEISGQYLQRGALAYIEGKLQTHTWEDRDGNKRHTTQVVAHSLQMLDRRDKGNQQDRHPAELGDLPEDDIPF
jgi:single-strand DNA-binding protein